MSDWDDVLDAMAKGADVNARDAVYQSSGLHEAIHCCAPLSVVKAMVEAGADVHAVTETGWTALHPASNYRRPHCAEGLAVVKYLMSKGVDHTKVTRSGSLPIHWAAMANNVPVLRYWVEEQHESVEVKCMLKRTPLLWAKDDTAGYLVVCANANPLAKDKVRRVERDGRCACLLTVVWCCCRTGQPPWSVALKYEAV